MPSVCTFQLNKANATYFNGETIEGSVILKTTSEKNVRDVCIIFTGKGKVKWEEEDINFCDEDDSTTDYISRDTYINNSKCVHGEGVLAAGTHTYTFNIPLPWDCPTSIECNMGYIRYEISLKINRYYRFDNVFQKQINVIKKVDLNLIPTYKLPVVVESFGSSCCFICFNSKILITFRIPFGAYTPDEFLEYDLSITNQSMDNVEGYDMEFCQKITFTAKSPSRKQKYTKKVLVFKSYSEKCLRLTNKILHGGFLIPATPSTTDKSSIICVEYTLKVTVHLPCCSSDPVLKIPIIIGTVPIRESGKQLDLPSSLLRPELPDKDIGSNLPTNNNELSSSTSLSDVNIHRGNRMRFTEKYY